MKQRQMVVENPDGSRTVYIKTDAIGIVGEIVGIAGGFLAGGFVGVQVWKAIGPAKTIAEKIGKGLLVGSITTATEYYVSEGVSATFNNVAEGSDWVQSKIRLKADTMVQEVQETE